MKPIHKLEDATKEELVTAIKDWGEGESNKIMDYIEQQREMAEAQAQEEVKKKEAADWELIKTTMNEWYMKLDAALKAENLPWDTDMSGTRYLNDAGVMIDVDYIKNAASAYVGGYVYVVGYYETDEDRAPQDEPQKMRTTTELSDVITWLIDAASCPLCHSRQVERSPGSAGYLQCKNCGNEWR
jgi:hypothetical protein